MALSDQMPSLLFKIACTDAASFDCNTVDPSATTLPSDPVILLVAPTCPSTTNPIDWDVSRIPEDTADHSTNPGPPADVVIDTSGDTSAVHTRFDVNVATTLSYCIDGLHIVSEPQLVSEVVLQ